MRVGRWIGRWITLTALASLAHAAFGRDCFLKCRGELQDPGRHLLIADTWLNSERLSTHIGITLTELASLAHAAFGDLQDPGRPLLIADTGYLVE